jgi:hypothetical protein
MAFVVLLAVIATVSAAFVMRRLWRANVEARAAFQAPPPPRSDTWPPPAPAPVEPTVIIPGVDQSASDDRLPPVDEEAFLAWLKAGDLLKTSHTPEQMMELRRQFLGVD